MGTASRFQGLYDTLGAVGKALGLTSDPPVAPGSHLTQQGPGKYTYDPSGASNRESLPDGEVTIKGTDITLTVKNGKTITAKDASGRPLQPQDGKKGEPVTDPNLLAVVRQHTVPKPQ